MIAYEPEAAALFCKQLPTDRMAANDEPIQFVADQPYIVVDLGSRYWRISDRFSLLPTMQFWRFIYISCMVCF